MAEVRHPTPENWPREFHTTRWSRVIRAGDPTQEAAQEALASLCQDYWRPLYYFALRKGHGPEDAQDLTQGFIARLLERNSLAAADRERGRFRTFLLSAFSHYLSNQVRDASTQKRGGGAVVLSLDREGEENFQPLVSNETTPEMQYERNWALALLDRVMARLREEYHGAGREELFGALQPHLSAANRPGYAGLGADLGMSESGVAVAVHRMRRRYGELLREEIASTVSDLSEVEDEVRYLIRVIS